MWVDFIQRFQSAELAVINTSELPGDPHPQMSFSRSHRPLKISVPRHIGPVWQLKPDLIWFKISPTPEHFCPIVASALVCSPPTTHGFHSLMLPECYVMGAGSFPKLAGCVCWEDFSALALPRVPNPIVSLCCFTSVTNGEGEAERRHKFLKQAV